MFVQENMIDDIFKTFFSGPHHRLHPNHQQHQLAEPQEGRGLHRHQRTESGSGD